MSGEEVANARQSASPVLGAPLRLALIAPIVVRHFFAIVALTHWHHRRVRAKQFFWLNALVLSAICLFLFTALRIAAHRVLIVSFPEQSVTVSTIPIRRPSCTTPFFKL
jgi:hypothetical protein